MKIIEKDHVVGGHIVGTYLIYDDIEPELTVMKPRDKVLPAPFFYEKRMNFLLIRKWEPGENKFYPGGGFEVRDESGGVRHYDLNQVILHPSVIKHKKTLALINRIDDSIKIEDNKPIVAKVSSGRRGRPALDPEVKAAKEAEALAKSQRSGGRRGRPASTAPKVIVDKVKTDGKRGRPSLTPEEIANRDADKAAMTKRSGGKRGRPKSAK
jgi:hypothetical protein